MLSWNKFSARVSVRWGLSNTSDSVDLTMRNLNFERRTRSCVPFSNVLLQWTKISYFEFWPLFSSICYHEEVLPHTLACVGDKINVCSLETNNNVAITTTITYLAVLMNWCLCACIDHSVLNMMLIWYLILNLSKNSLLDPVLSMSTNKKE